MSDRHATTSAIHTNSSGLDHLPAASLATAIVVLVIGWSLTLQWVELTTPVGSWSLSTAVGVCHLLAGGVLLATGVLSTVGVIDTVPDERVGTATALVFGAIAFASVGLVASQTFGFGTVLWLPTSGLAAVAVVVWMLSLREDLAVTLPTGALELGIGLVVLTGTVGPAWTWEPTGFSATFVGSIAVATLCVVGGLSTLWASAVALRGFGPRGREFGAHALITVPIVALLVVLGLLVAFVVEKGLDPMLAGASLWPPRLPFVTNGFGLMFEVNGIFPAIVGTIWLVIGAVTFSVPLGVGAAIYLTEYAEQGRLTGVVEIATNGLWSTPSIVYGLFGYAFLVPRLGNHSSILAGQLVLGFMLLPLVLITSREALLNVPDEYRDSSAALGVSQWETIKSVVLPAAVPGILTGVILGVGRIAGETAPILLVLTREPFLAEAPHVLRSFHLQATPPYLVNDALLSPASALPYQLFAVITAGVGAPESFGWATALVLLVVVLSLYAVGITTRLYFRRRLRQ